MNWRYPKTYPYKGPCDTPVIKELSGRFETTYGGSFVPPKREEIINFTKTNRYTTVNFLMKLIKIGVHLTLTFLSLEKHLTVVSEILKHRI